MRELLESFQLPQKPTYNLENIISLDKACKLFIQEIFIDMHDERYTNDSDIDPAHKELTV